MRRYWKIIVLALGIIGAFVMASWATQQYALELAAAPLLQGSAGQAVYVVLTVAAVIVAPLVTLPLIPIAAGLWGPFATSILNIIGYTVGSAGAFGIARLWGQPFVDRLAGSDNLARVKNFLPEEHLFWGVILLRIAVPVDILSYAIGLFSNMRFLPYIIATFLGLIPFSFVFSYAASLPLIVQIAAGTAGFLILAAGVYYKRNSFTKTKNEFDVIVIGAGAGGLNVAGFMNKAGFKVLLIDKDNQSIGGDCLNFGCVPSKALLHVARQVKAARSADKFGLSATGRVDMEAVRTYIRSRQEIIREHENAEYFRRQGMTVVLGEARFADKKSVEVAGKKYTAKKIVLATGSRPRQLRVPGIENVNVHTNETIFDITELPERLLVIGGGPIGLEIGQAFLSLGSAVTVVQRGDSFLPKEDSEISNVLLKRLQKQGMKFYFNSEPVNFPSAHEVMIRDGGTEHRLKFDAVLVAIGREIVTGDVRPDKGGIKVKNNKFVIDSYLQTTNKRVLAVGDVVGEHQFTHAAELHAGLVIRNLFAPWRKKLAVDHMGWVTFTDPEIATFGLDEETLRARGVTYEVLGTSFSADDRAIIDGYTDGRIKLYVSRGKIMGGTLVAPSAGEIMQELMLASTKGIKLQRLLDKVYPYPTATRINRQLAVQYISQRLTERVRWVLRVLFH